MIPPAGCGFSAACARAVDGGPPLPVTPERGTSRRISKIAIIGRKRMNRKNRKRNIPIVPRYIVQSKIVG